MKRQNHENFDKLWLAAGAKTHERKYWLEKLSGELTLSRFPAIYKDKEKQERARGFVDIGFKDPLVQGLLKLANNSDVRLFVVLIALITLLLSKYSGIQDVIIGTPVIKSQGEKELINRILSLRNRVQPDMSFKDLLLQVRHSFIEAGEHCNYPFPVLIKELSQISGAGESSLFDVALLLDNIHERSYLSSATPGLVFSFHREGQTMSGQIEYSPARYDRETMERVARHFTFLIGKVLAGLDQKVNAIDLLSQEEKQLLLVKFNESSGNFPNIDTIQGLFEIQVRKTPDKMALVAPPDPSDDYAEPGPGTSLSYKQLDEAATVLSHKIRDHGLGANNIVGVLAERSLEMVVGLLGVLKSGCAYLPLNPKNPSSRNRFMLQDCTVELLLTTSFLEAQAREIPGQTLEIISIDEREVDGNVADFHRSSQSLAYVIYTSGSTGNPKGVPITHANICPLLHWGFAELGLATEDRVIQNLSYYFDWSAWEIFITLTSGASLHMIGDHILLNPEAETDFINNRGITVLHITPTQFQYLINRQVSFPTLSYLLLGAEKLTLDLTVRAFGQVHENCRVFNMYGPTEATIIVAVLEIDRAKSELYKDLSSVPIGGSVANTGLHIYNHRMVPEPIGVTGELYISGDALARGYLNMPELTAEQFIPVEMVPVAYTGELKGIPLQNNTLYRTGDRARWLPDGTVEFLGRVDHQVKVRGYRIEPGEIEKILLDHPAVGEALVIALAYKGGENYLCAYLVLKEPTSLENPSQMDFRDFLNGEVPDYMVPSHFLFIEQMPLNPNGKVDLKALPEPEQSRGAAYVPPRNEVEERLLAVWSLVLYGKGEEGQPPMGIDDNFFQLGGHSLKATRLVQQIYTEFQVNIEIKDVFQYPTVRMLTPCLQTNGPVVERAIPAVEKREYYPLSYAQRRLWVLCQFEEDSTAYNMPSALVFQGKFKIGTFQGAVETLARRHESLRTVFMSIKGDPIQKVIQDISYTPDFVDLTSLDGEARAVEARRIYQQVSNKAFDLEKWPLFRFMILRLEEEKHLLIYNIHHIVNDGWSQGNISNEIIGFYNNYLDGKPASLPSLTLQYRDYTCWHNQLIETGSFGKSRTYWLEKLADKPNGIELPLDRQRQPIQTFNGGRVDFTLNRKQTEALYEIGNTGEATLFMSLLCLLDIFLYKYTGQKDCVIGSPIAGRRLPELHNMVGFLVNTLVFRNTLEPGLTFMEYLNTVKKEALDCYAYQDYPFDLLIEELGLERDLSQSPLFNVMLAHNNADTELSGLALKGLTVSGYEHLEEFNMSKFDLTFFMDEVDDHISVRLEYNSDLFDRETIERWAVNFQVLVDNVIAGPEKSIYELSALGSEEYEQITRVFNETQVNFPQVSLMELFSGQALKNPDKVAVVGIRRPITYGELNLRANRLAHYLRNEQGVDRNQIIGVSMDRSIEMVVVILGIMKSGAAYLAVDPAYPRDRVTHVLSDSKADILIIDWMRPEIFSGFPGRILNFLELEPRFDEQTDSNPEVKNKPLDMLYINYTSGSTGTPNGAMLSHDCLTNLILWQNNSTSIDCSKRVLQFTSINFCVSFQEIMGTLTVGGELHLIGDLKRQEIDYLMDFLSSRRIQVLFLPFSYLNFLFNESSRWDRDFDHSLEHIITAGEQLKVTSGLKEFLDSNPHIKLHNHYGSTEMHVVTSYTLDASTAAATPIPPAGKPVSNVSIYILDEYLNPVPLGVYGELCVAGSMEILGYIHNTQLTDEKLAQCPALAPVRLYRSGDIGRMLPDGNIELRGRRDFMVKVRGFRVEPGEIESKILAIKKVRECVVVVLEDEKGQKYLAAYVVAQGMEGRDIKRALANDLPQYMVPSIILLDHLPLMPNGKVDREKLPKPQLGEGGDNQAYVAPRDQLEEKLVEIWLPILYGKGEYPPLGIDDSFFSLGGHSLKATSMASAIQKQLEKEVPLVQIFKTPTIREIADFIRGAGSNAEYYPLSPVEKKEYYPMSYAQRRLWVLCQFEEDSTAYNMPAALVLNGPFNVAVFGRAVETLAQRHESLRTIFVTIQGTPFQKVIQDFSYTPEFLDFSHIPGKAREKKARSLYQEAANKAFQLDKGLLFRFIALRLEEEKHLLIYNIHHIVNDGWSLGNISNEIIHFYNNYLQGKPSSLTDLTLQYRDYSNWHNNLLESGDFGSSKTYWLKKLGDKPNGIELPMDRQRQPVQTFNGGRVEFKIDKSQAHAFSELAKKGDATLFMCLLSLVDIFLYKYSGQGDILIGSPIAGRRRPELHSMIGFLVNTLVFRNSVEPGQTFMEHLAAVKGEALDCYAYQDYPFDLLVEKLDLERDLSQSPLFNVMLAHNNTDTVQADLSLEEVKVLGYEHMGVFNMSKFDLTFFMDEVDDHIFVRLEYNSDLFDRETIERWAANFQVLVDHIIVDPHKPISELTSLGSEEYEQVTRACNQTQVDFPHASLMEIFSGQALKNPEKVAVVGINDLITYGELNLRANRLAHYLRKEQGVDRNQIIGVSMDRSIEMIIVLLGIMKSGAAYLAVDPTYPPDRVAHVLSDSRADVLIIDRMRPEIFSSFPGRILNVLELTESVASFPGHNLEVKNEPQDILYINYTSGSTGTPNGAMLSHDCLTNLIQWQSHKTSIDCSKGVLQFTSINFCVSFQEIMGTLTGGGELHLIGDVERQDIDYLMDFLVSHRIQVLFLPFSYLNFLFNESNRWDRDFQHSLEHIITAGEQLKVTAGLKGFLDLNPHIQLHNHYGSTEMHVVTSYTLDASTAAETPIPPAGKPVSNVDIYILDEYLNPVPLGVYGELCVAGSTEILGYVHNPDLTGKKLVHCPSLSPVRLYRSGDMGRLLPNGNIELRGRRDFMVKVRGFRVEPGEIESKILAIEKVRECVVVLEDEKGQKYLAGYVSAKDIKGAEIKRILGNDLPQYMVPRIILLDQLPLMPNGKVDREKLPKPEPGTGDESESFVAPQDELEEKLVEIWIGNLYGKGEYPPLGIDDNFFSLGGHSLKATLMAAAIQKELSIEVPLVEIFKTPTIREIADIIRGGEALTKTTLFSAPLAEFYPLSPAQQRIFILHRMETENISYNMPALLVLQGKVDKDRLEETLIAMIHRHECLRTLFTIHEGKPVQQVLPPEEVVFGLEYLDAPGKEDSELHKEVEQFIRHFDLEKAPLFRVRLIPMSQSGKNPGEHHLLAVDMHHIISDGTSIGIMVREFMDLYSGEKLQELSVQYKDYAYWLTGSDAQERVAGQEHYWLEQFSGEIPLLQLPYDYSRPYPMSFQGGRHVFEIGVRETASLNRLAGEEGVTLYMVLAAMLNLLLSRLSGEEDLVLGTPTAGRRFAELQPIIGMFINTLGIRTQPTWEKSFAGYLKELKTTTLEAFENQDYPFEDLVEKLAVKRDGGRNPLFDVMFVLQNMDIPTIEIPGLTLSSYEYENRTVKFDMTIQAMESSEKLIFSWEYATGLFKKETIVRFGEYFKNIVGAVIADRVQVIGTIDFIPGQEKEFILETCNQTQTPYPDTQTIHGLFLEQVAKYPNRVALEGLAKGQGSGQLSYSELCNQVWALKEQLIEKGVLPGHIVALLTTRSQEMIIGIMGIMMTGGAYLPMELDYPQSRMDFMLRDSGAEIIITDLEDVPTFSDSIQIMSIDTRSAVVPVKKELSPPGKGEDIAYIIYTSGTTGKPKGNLTPHRSAVRVVCQTNYIEITKSDRVLQLSNYAFDGSVFDIYGALLNGAALIIPVKEDLMELDRLTAFIVDRKVSLFFLTTALFNTLIDFDPYSLSHVRKVLYGGERVSVSHARRGLEVLGPNRLIHVYGPTETTVFASYYPIDFIEEHAVTIPIGAPIANTTIYINDKYGGTQPMGVAGEIYIGGDGLARGYLNRPELTAEKFLDNKLYKTGDLGHFLPHGSVEFLGRSDHQVKLRGFRIELKEIESVLLSHESIKEAVVVARGDQAGDKYLCAYMIALAKSGSRPDPRELRDFLARELPAYMVPAYFMFLDAIPLNLNGKIDLGALPEPASRENRDSFTAPKDALEEKLASLWQEVLYASGEVKPIGIHEDFFELGGHSLKATVLINKIHKALAVKIPLIRFFDNPTIHGLATHIRNSQGNVFQEIPVVEEKDFYPLSPAQQRIFILHRMKAGNISYNMPVLLVLQGKLDKDRLEETLIALIHRHESLRTSFTIHEGVPVQRILTIEEVVFKLEYINSPGKDDDQLHEEVEQFIRSFDLEKAPLFRVRLIPMSDFGKSLGERFLLAVDMHHIISDGTSIGIMVREFMALYGYEELQDLPVQYKDYAYWLQGSLSRERVAGQEKYWLEQFAGDVPLLELPYDYPRPYPMSLLGRTCVFEMDYRDTASLNRLANEEGVTLYMVLAGIFNVLLARLSGSEDLVLGTPTAGRRSDELQPIIGMFINTLGIRTRPKGDKTFANYLKELKVTTLNAFENQDYPFEDLVEKLAVKRDASRNPLFDVMFILQNMDIPTIKIPGLTLSGYEYENQTAKFDITLQAMESSGKLIFSWDYVAALFKEETMVRFVEYFQSIVQEVIADRTQVIGIIDFIPEAEKKFILKTCNQTTTPYPADKTIIQLFMDQVDRTPDGIALIGESGLLEGGTHFTYSELEYRATQLAAIIQAGGVRPGHLVGILIKRNVEMIIGLIAVLRTGAAYLPLDPGYPKQRLWAILEESDTCFVLADDKGHSTLMEMAWMGQVIQIDGGDIPGKKRNLHSIESHSHDLAYVIYTSGSTGNPKGVTIEHRSVINLMEGLRDTAGLFPGRTILNVTTICFDIFVLETWLPLMTGTKIVLAAESHQVNPDRLSRIILEEQVQILQFTPSRLKLMLNSQRELEFLQGVDTLLVGGEQFSQSLFKNIERHYRGRLFNMYGPTETTVWSSFVELRWGDAITIGKPIANTRIIIVDKNGNRQPIGIPGECCIGGDGLARGYLNNPTLTEQYFVDYPKERLYRTGDLARLLPDGNIEFLGRLDHQVKIRGFRIELGEIESQLLRHSQVKEAVLIDRSGPEGDKYLCAYLVASCEAVDLRTFLTEKLPNYMVPSRFVFLKKIPLTANGKVDRKALPEPDFIDSKESIAPRNQIERKLAILWWNILFEQQAPEEGITLGIDDNFFELGGHSLRATILSSQIHKTLDVNVHLEQIFKTPTIRQLALFIESARKDQYKALPLAEKREYYRLSPSQKRLYMLQQMDPETVAYNIPEVVRLKGHVDKVRIENTIRLLVEMHESFRTTFVVFQDEVVQKITRSIPFEMEYFESKEPQSIIDECIRPFDLSKTPLLRACLIENRENGDCILLLDMHHIISDGTSLGIFMRDLAKLYNEGEAVLKKQLFCYKDYSEWTHSEGFYEMLSKQESYWLERFSGPLPVLNLPFDFERPRERDLSGSNLVFELEAEYSQLLKEMALKAGTSLFVVLLAALNVFLSKASGQEDIVVGTQIAGRRHPDLQRIIGDFLNTLALRNYPTKEKSFAGFLEEVNEQTLSAYENQEYQFETLVGNVSVNRDVNRNPLFDVMFVWQNVEKSTMQIPGLSIEPFQYDMKSRALIDLSLYGHEKNGKFEFVFEYNTALFKEKTILRFVKDFKDILAEITTSRDILIGDINVSHDLGVAEFKTFQDNDEDFGF